MKTVYEPLTLSEFAAKVNEAASKYPDLPLNSIASVCGTVEGHHNPYSLYVGDLDVILIPRYKASQEDDSGLPLERRLYIGRKVKTNSYGCWEYMTITSVSSQPELYFRCKRASGSEEVFNASDIGELVWLV